AAIEGMAIDGLPVMHHLSWIFADEIRLNFLDGFGAGFGPSFEDRLAQSGEAGVGVDLQKQPARLDEKSFELRDFQRFLGRDGSVLAPFLSSFGAGQHGQAQSGQSSGENRATMRYSHDGESPCRR